MLLKKNISFDKSSPTLSEGKPLKKMTDQYTLISDSRDGTFFNVDDMVVNRNTETYRQSTLTNI